jgi:hypothetical protein
MAMKGIVPPTPIAMLSRPKQRCDASCTARSSHGSSGGAFQPAFADYGVNVSRAR